LSFTTVPIAEHETVTWVESFKLEDAMSGSERVLDWLLGTPAQIVCIIAGAMVVRWLVHRAIQRLVARAANAVKRADEPRRRGSKVLAGAAGALVSERRKQRAETVGSVLRSVSSIVIFGLGFITVLDKLGIPIAPLLASAGVAGVALGFGAQSLVRDFLSGIFMILEDQYGVGDLIDTGEAVGTVEEVSLRLTRLRDAYGVVWYVRNGEILRVGNHSQGWSTGIVDVDVAYTEDIPRVQEIMRQVAAAMAEDEDWVEKIVDDPLVAGVESVTSTAVSIRVIVKTQTNEHFGVQRELRERIKAAFDLEGIRVPVPTYPLAPDALLSGAAADRT
jgi:small-conductance mechanosensitive channel